MVEVAGVAREAGRIRVGLVGAGNWAFHGHLRVLDLLPNYEVVAVYARRREAAEQAAQRYGIRHITVSIAELVALSDVDVVIVLTTAPQHEEAVRAAIAAGKHVYCEWPLTISTQRAEEIERLVRDAGVRDVVGLQRRLAPHNRYVRDPLAQGYVGRLRSVRMHVSMNYFQAVLPNALRWTVPAENFSSVVAICAVIALGRFPPNTVLQASAPGPAIRASLWLLFLGMERAT
jgi:predicted dehydrogenase